jgi:hypothetical protein
MPRAHRMHRMHHLPAPALWVLDLLLVPVLWAAAFWVRRRQSFILCHGLPLSVEQQLLARAVGVESPQRVRVMTAHVIPLPVPRWLCGAAQRAGWLSSRIAGMTLDYGIVLRTDCWGDACHDRCLLAHELAHVAQYERLGGVRGFLRQYLRECVWPGYPRGALEVEARAAEAQGSMRRADVIPYATPAAD